MSIFKEKKLNIAQFAGAKNERLYVFNFLTLKSPMVYFGSVCKLDPQQPEALVSIFSQPKKSRGRIFVPILSRSAKGKAKCVGVYEIPTKLKKQK